MYGYGHMTTAHQSGALRNYRAEIPDLTDMLMVWSPGLVLITIRTCLGSNILTLHTSKVVPTHLWNTPLSPKPLPRGYKKIPFIFGWEDCLEGELQLPWNNVDGRHPQKRWFIPRFARLYWGLCIPIGAGYFAILLSTVQGICGGYNPKSQNPLIPMTPFLNM